MSRPDPQITWPTLVIFGDSITEGAGDQTGRGWADRLKAEWRMPRPHESGYPAGSNRPNVYSLGIDGDRTIDVLNRFDIEVAARRAWAIILFIGANDLRWTDRPQSTGLTEFASQYHRLVERAVDVTPRVLCLTLLEADEAVLGHGIANQEVRQFNQAITAAAGQYHAHVLDVAQLLAPSDYCDGIHPNDAGYSKLYQTVSATLHELRWDDR